MSEPADAAALAARASVERPELAAPYQSALVIANPIAGRGLAATVAREMAEGLKRADIRTELYVTRERGDGRARLRCQVEPLDLVVSVGGDGTLREALDGLLDPETPVAVVPVGTANVLALDFELPRDVDRALETILARKTKRIDVARVNGRLSFLVVGVGFDGHAVHDVERTRRGPITKWNYVGAVLRTLRTYKVPKLTVTLDGEELEQTYGWVLVSNIEHYGGVFRLGRTNSKADGRFDVFLFREASLPHLLAAAARGLTGDLGSVAEVRACRRVKIESDEPVPVQVDGEASGTTPIEFEIAPRQYRILVP